ncbi:terpene synthase family protein [Agromyces sp. NPDC058126]|uniref:terpene synthase family protein n=1 Tax=Agromyces sp. NPDC058126 TaxID=3346350 RepID=UPI0036DD388B
MLGLDQVSSINHSLGEWASRVELTPDSAAQRRLLSIDLGYLAVGIHPQAATIDLTLEASWMAWALALDDTVDNGELGKNPNLWEELFATLKDVVRSSPTPRLHVDTSPHPVAVALSDLWSRTAQHTTTSWQERFRTHLDEHLGALELELTNRASGHRLNVAQFREHRLGSSGMDLAFDLAEVTTWNAMPDNAAQHVDYLAVRKLANEVVCLTNDLYSLSKESGQEDTHNLVIVLAFDLNLSLLEAASLVEQLLTIRLDELISAQNTLMTSSLLQQPDAYHRDQMRRVGRTLMRWAETNFHWMVNSGRYREFRPGDRVESAFRHFVTEIDRPRAAEV